MANTNRKTAAILVLLGVLAIMWSGPAAAADTSECVACHTSPDRLKEFTKNSDPALAPGHSTRSSMGGSFPARERWERVYIDPAFLEDESHGSLGCQKCHGGTPDPSGATDFNSIHKGVNYQPSHPSPSICGECHEEDQNFGNSLHSSVKGMKTPVLARAGDDPVRRGQVERAMDAHCLKCHATCGSCHVSRPIQSGGGFSKGHKFYKTPEMDTTCAACHGHTVMEFKGAAKGTQPDVHSEAGMDCQECHKADQMHGGEKAASSRYESQGPQCLTCHDGIYAADAPNKEAHSLHKGRVSCQVCHSTAYTNCAQCHLDKDFSQDKYKEWTAFKIGFNPAPTEARPEKVVTVRHVPVWEGMFDKAGAEGMLPTFAGQPTWKSATPHTIRRQTPQNAKCNNCHGVANMNLYLTRADVPAELRAANRPAMVPPAKIPKPVADKKE